MGMHCARAEAPERRREIFETYIRQEKRNEIVEATNTRSERRADQGLIRPQFVSSGGSMGLTPTWACCSTECEDGANGLK